VMRSGAGAVCPRSRRLECLPDFFTRDLPAAEAAGFAELRVLFAPVNAAEHVPAVRSSAKPAVIDVRSLIQPRRLRYRYRALYIAKGAIRQ
jgi:hypothetical protein